ncbi:hypothetical protein LTR74_010301 [Friedmanniomyces endolithicus]|nr:hypothetical protein LTR74_010301 [Friedmanniomyces endolithicus]
MSQDHVRYARYSRKYNAALWFYDRNQLNERAHKTFSTIRFHRMKTLILLASITGWHDAEDCRIEAEQFWVTARNQYSSHTCTFDEEEALTELRTQLDALKAAQDFELFGGPQGWVGDGEDLDARPAGLEDDGEDLGASASDLEVEEAAQAQGVEGPRSDLDMALPVAQVTATASDLELDTTASAAGVLTPLPFFNVDFAKNMPHRPAHHTRDA